MVITMAALAKIMVITMVAKAPILATTTVTITTLAKALVTVIKPHTTVTMVVFVVNAMDRTTGALTDITQTGSVTAGTCPLSTTVVVTPVFGIPTAVTLSTARLITTTTGVLSGVTPAPLTRAVISVSGSKVKIP